jgi:tetratricopeptide (TPR) repeat protein
MVQAVFSIDVPQVAFLPWLAIGGIWALTADAERRTSRADSGLEQSGIRTVPSVAVVILCALMLVVVTRPLRADQLARASDFGRAIALNGSVSAYHGLYGTALANQASAERDLTRRNERFRQAEKELERSAELAPNTLAPLETLVNLDVLRARMGDVSGLDQAEKWWQRMLATDPTDNALRVDHRTALATMTEIAASATRGDPEDSEPWLQLARLRLAQTDQAGALEAIRQAAAVAPDRAEVLELLRQLSVEQPPQPADAPRREDGAA